mgnify:CR=1 FL=1
MTAKIATERRKKYVEAKLGDAEVKAREIIEPFHVSLHLQQFSTNTLLPVQRLIRKFSPVPVRAAEEGEAATLEVGVHGIHPELVKLLGKMKFRTSYGQNALKHSPDKITASGVSSIIKSTPVIVSNVRILRPSLPEV